MTNNFPRVMAILSRIPDAATRWPGWMWPVCPECGHDCTNDFTEFPFCENPDCDQHFKAIKTIQRFCPIADESDADAWHGNDTDPRNMHHLWAMLEAVDISGYPNISSGDVSIWHGGMLVIGREKDHSIIEAMLRCLEEATR